MVSRKLADIAGCSFCVRRPDRKEERVEMLMKRDDFDINLAKHLGRSPLRAAIEAKHDSVLAVIVGNDFVNINSPFSGHYLSQTPLCFAVYLGQIPLCIAIG